MNYVATILAAADGDLSAHDLAQISHSLSAASKPIWLAAGKAADIGLHKMPDAESLTAARAAALPQRIDIIAQPIAHRRKAVFLADMEGTIIANEMLEEMADFVGLREAVAEITLRSMNGELDFAASLQERVQLMRGLKLEQLAALAGRIRYHAGVRSLLRTLRAAGTKCWLVTGGFTLFAELVAKELGFHALRANQLEVAAGALTGGLVPPILDAAGKAIALQEACAQTNQDTSATLATGDGANDLMMLKAAGLGVAYRPKPVVAAQILNRLDVADFTALAYVQGFRAEELASDLP